MKRPHPSLANGIEDGTPCSPMNATAINRYEQSRKDRQYWMLSKSEQAQEEHIAAHYVAFAHLALQLKELIEARKRCQTEELNDLIRFLTGKIREGHLMEFGIELKWQEIL